MKNTFSYLFLLVIALGLVMTFPENAEAQCAMCRASVENNISNGNVTVGAGLNTGIIYLMVMPYLAFAAIAFFWYRNSRKNQRAKMQIAQRIGIQN